MDWPEAKVSVPGARPVPRKGRIAVGRRDTPHNYISQRREAETFQRMIDDMGCTQDALAAMVGHSQPYISQRLKLLRTDEYHPPPLPRWTEHTNPWAPPPPGPEKLLKLWCANVAETLGWQVATEYPLPRLPPPAVPRRATDIVLSLPGQWKPVLVIEVKRSLTRLEGRDGLRAAVAQRWDSQDRLGCDGLVVAGILRADFGAEAVIADEMENYIGRP